MLRNIPLDLIDPNPDQPRKTFEEGPLRELAASIEAEGLIQPITVRARGERFIIVAGERRFQATKLLADEGRLEEPVITARLRRMTDLEMAVQAVIENLQREDVPPLEEAAAFRRLVDQGLTPAEVAKRCGVALFRVNWRLQLLNLQGTARHLFETGQIDRNQANELSRLPTEAEQDRVLGMISRGQLIGWKAVRTAVDAILDPQEQVAMFGDTGPTEKDRKTASDMASRIHRAATALSGGWKDGECIVAAKVDPGAAEKLADQLSAMQAMIRHMERQLRNTVAGARAIAAE